MKKTLTTAILTAIAATSVQAAVTLDKSDLLNAGGTYTLTTEEMVGANNGNFVVTAVLDATAFQSLFTGDTLTTTATPLFAAKGTSNKVGLCAKVDGTNEGLWGSWYNGSSWNYGWELSAPSGSSYTLKNVGALLSENTYDSIAVSLVIGGAGTIVNLTLVGGEDVGTTTIKGQNSSLKSSNIGKITELTYDSDYVQYVLIQESTEAMGWYEDPTTVQAVNLGAIADAKVANVPEPATATLSLLALAGLAARRRRK